MELQTDQEQRWDLTRLYASPEDPQIDEDLERARAAAERVRDEYVGRVATLTPGEIRAIIDALDAQTAITNKLFYYAYLRFSCDTQDYANKNLYARMQREVPEIQNETGFFLLELQRLSGERFAELLEAPELAEYKDYLGRIRRAAAHALDAFTERVITLKDSTGIQA